MTEEKPQGVIITIRDIHETVQDLKTGLLAIDNKMGSVVELSSDIEALESRIRKVETQTAAFLVVHMLSLGAIAALIGKFFS